MSFLYEKLVQPDDPAKPADEPEHEPQPEGTPQSQEDGHGSTAENSPARSEPGNGPDTVPEQQTPAAGDGS